MTKYARFFTIAGKMEWDSIRDDGDLAKRVVASMDKDEREQFEAEREALTKPGGFIKFPYMLIVRTET